MKEKIFSLKSMTAFGQSYSDFAFGRFTVEIQSVNRRFLEINISLPKTLARFEMDVRNWLGSRVSRGTVNVSIYLKDQGNRPFSVKPNLKLAKAVKEAWELIARELSISDEVDFSLLAREKDLLIYEEELPENEEIYKKALEKAVVEALDSLNAMKEKEGKKLAHDLHERLAFLKSTLEKIESMAPHAVEKYRQKLTARLEELFSQSEENEEKVLREIAVFAEKIDITEEIVRFKSHIDQFSDLLVKPLESETEARGRTLDFLIQELNREVNTIGSKSSDKAVSQYVIEMKSELEKIREQAQNIE